MTRAKVFEVFKDAVGVVWSNADFVLPHLSFDETLWPSGECLAALVFEGNPRAIGTSILRRAPRYILLMSPKLLTMNPEAIWKIMVHEAVHIGHRGHGGEFRKLVRQFGGAVSGTAVENPVVMVQTKVGLRYQTVRKFEDEREAELWARAQQRAQPGTRWRLMM